MTEPEWPLIKQTLDRNGLTCQMCGAAAGEIEPTTGQSVRIHFGRVKIESLGSIEGMPDLQALCSTCNEGAKNITGEKPNAIWLLSQVRRAGQDEQRAVYDWLTRKFGSGK